MSEPITLARPYAEAAFKHALESGRLEQWSKMLAFLAAALSDPELVALAQNPKIGKERFLQILLDIGKGYLDAEGQNFVKLLVHNDRITLAPQIHELFERYRAEHEGIVDVEVRTAYPLEAEDQAKLTRALEKALGRKIRLQLAEDRDLIGGVVIRAGDKVIDGSVRGRLERLAKRLYS
ncbi:F-type H+-transporting ATPase subunit delta [Methylomarinovum tepidoasis]|uniref:ATP synthase subunit delta n=1 Tax=Methylomarinovum tepidoasis TaxID=2840183 RepID=A0AAU9C956_9GAMM|nr:F0F1 ATP synthase subunit delta [Methylomarinovum sp. IN45]BCX88412.1 F-type H+-transporting ATPase subunit delta [Methylomarinovum sp. IN45]